MFWFETFSQVNDNLNTFVSVSPIYRPQSNAESHGFLKLLTGQCKLQHILFQRKKILKKLFCSSLSKFLCKDKKNQFLKVSINSVVSNECFKFSCSCDSLRNILEITFIKSSFVGFSRHHEKVFLTFVITKKFS